MIDWVPPSQLSPGDRPHADADQHHPQRPILLAPDQ